MKKIALAMSGGVDSSAAALLLQRDGWSVTGVTFSLWGEENAAARRAALVCASLGIEHRVLDLRAPFLAEVVEPFCAEYRCGRTPNPCVLCNRQIKFGAFADYARAQGFDRIATGHYVRTGFDADTGRWFLRRAASEKKDQSYFMFRVPQQSLSMFVAPLGEYDKPQVRAIAAAAGLAVATERDSQDVCFIPGGDYAAFLRAHTGAAPLPGDFVDSQGRVLGRHTGVSNYTIGQRKGLGVALGRPAFVSAIDSAANTVTLTTEEAALFRTALTVRQVALMALPALDGPFRAAVKLRSAHSPAPATVTPQPDGSLEVRFDTPQRAPAPGQSAVFYAQDRVLAGGSIE